MNSNISYTLNTSSRKSRFRPNSATKRPLNIFKKNISKDTPPPILYTLPSTQQKKRSGMGNKIEREELYEYNMQLKDIINSLKKELAEVKHKVVKKDIEIRKKEKLIKECSKENDIESNHELNLEKARESTLISLYKKQYNELKDSFNKKVKENNELNATYKITKLKEYTVQIDVLKKEMEKMRNLYRQTVENNNKLTLEIQSLKELKKFFIEQHEIIDKLEQTILHNKEEIQNLKQENEDYRDKLERNFKKQKILKDKNFKLKISNKKFLDIKKNRENYELFMDDNKKRIETLKKDLDEYKRLYELTRNEYNKIVEQRDKKEQNKPKNEENFLNPYKAMGIIEVKKENEETNKLSLYKSLVEEYKVKIEIYETYLKKIGIDKDALIKAFGYDGVVSASTKINQNEIENINNNNNLVSIESNPNNNVNPESSEENFVQIGDNLSTANTNTNTITNTVTNANNVNRNSVSTSNNFNNNNNDKLPSIEEEKIEPRQQKKNSSSLLLKCL